MPTLTITLPTQSFRKIKKRAQKEGFKNPTDWARFLVEKNISLEELPRMKPKKIIEEMKKTNHYTGEFLRGLKRSLEYADKAA